MGPRLFERNIRFGLGEEEGANRSLRRAFEKIVIDGADPAGLFAFTHNGVTLSVEKLVVEDGTARVTEPRVLNGAQTLTTLARFIERNREHPEFRKRVQRPDLEEMEVDGNQKPIQIRPLAQTFLAVQGELDRMSRLGDVFEDEKAFRRTFPESYLRVDPRKIVLVYKVHLRRRALLRHLAEHKGPSFEFIQRGWNLVQALLVQALFNNKDLSSWLERFGTTTSMETDYTEVLRSLLLSKVVPVIKRAASESPYAESLAEGKYAFLRTKAFFGKCMDQAENDYGWEKRSF
ncbi:MAG: AIPR family protein [Holophagales bacterium]|nr:AIPR family protein [Holophagales bacterium]